MNHTPRRSALYLPCANPRALEKARILPVDCLILDLEDAVAPAAKQLARTQMIEAIQAGRYGKREVIIRINGLNTTWGETDLQAVAQLPVDAVLLPKVETPDTILKTIDLLNTYNPNTTINIWAMIETPRGILNAQAIAASHPRLNVLVMGTSDLAKDLRVKHTTDRIGLITALSLTVLAARTHNLDILDGVHLDLDDEAGFVLACEQGKNMGFDGKTVIHPKQIELANQIFAPSATEIVHAQTVVEAFTQAQKAGKGVALVEGKLVENLHYEEAKRLLAIADVIRERNRPALLT